jgi:inositol transport system substrate-binding protein
MKRKVIAILGIVCLILAAAALTGCTEKKATVYKIGYSNNSDSDLFNKIKRDTFEELTKDDATLEVVFTNPSFDLQKQFDQVDNFITQKYDAIVLIPVDTDGIIPAVEAANKAGIPVLCVGIDSGGGDRIFVGTEYVDGGIRQGKYMVEHLPQGANVVYLSGTPGYSHARDRRQGFLDTLVAGRPDVTVIADKTANYERSDAIQLMEDWLTAFPKIDAVVAANDEMALGALEALKGVNRQQGVLIAGVDAVDGALLAIKNGEMALTILQAADAMMQKTYDVIKRLQKGETVEKEFIIPHTNITIENVDDYL